MRFAYPGYVIAAALLWPLTCCAIKRAEHRRAKRPERRPCLSAASLGAVPLRPTNRLERFGPPNGARAKRGWGTWMCPSPERRAPMQLHRIGARPGASGFGHFCRNKSDPLKADACDVVARLRAIRWRKEIKCNLTPFVLNRPLRWLELDSAPDCQLQAIQFAYQFLPSTWPH